MQTKYQLSVLYLFLLGFIFMPTAYASPQLTQALQVYIEQHYGDTLKLNSQEFNQILWLETTDIQSHDNIASTDPYPLNHEVIHLLNRLDNLRLLRDGSDNSYKRFIKPQKENHYTLPVLSRHQFGALSHLFSPTKLPKSRYFTLRAAIIVSAVARTDMAQKLAQQAWNSQGLGALPQNDVEFLWKTVNHEPSIYPLITTLPVKQKPFLKTAFLPNSHLRHMLHAEGNKTMFYHLIDSFQPKELDAPLARDAFNFWFMVSLVDLSAFLVNTAMPNGSYYLNGPEARNAIMQWHLLTNSLFNQKVWQTRTTIAQKLLTSYLSYRARILSLNDINQKDVLVYGGLASLLRIHTTTQADDLHKAYSQLDPEKKNTLRQIYKDKLVQDMLHTPTYLPEVFTNLNDTFDNFQHSFEIFIDIYIQSMQLLKEKKEANELPTDKPVSFKALTNAVDVIAEMRFFSVKLSGYNILLDTDLSENSISIKAISMP